MFLIFILALFHDDSIDWVCTGTVLPVSSSYFSSTKLVSWLTVWWMYGRGLVPVVRELYDGQQSLRTVVPGLMLSSMMGISEDALLSGTTFIIVLAGFELQSAIPKTQEGFEGALPLWALTRWPNWLSSIWQMVPGPPREGPAAESSFWSLLQASLMESYTLITVHLPTPVSSTTCLTCMLRLQRLYIFSSWWIGNL